MRSSTRYWPIHALLGWFNLVLTAPAIYLYLGLPLVMREHGWSGTAIGLFQLAGIPALLKFVLATPIERLALGRLHYRNWSMLLLLAYAMALLGLAAHDIHAPDQWGLFALAMAASLLGTWSDIPVNALAIKYLPESERIRAGAVRSAATSLGAIVGGGLMLMVQIRAGWAWPFWILAGALVSAVGLLLTLGRPVGVAPMKPRQAKVRIGWRQCLSYFSTPGHRAWLPLLLLYFPFIGAVWVYLKPLLLDHGFKPEDVAWVAGVLGGVLGAAGSLLGERLTRRSGIAIAHPAFAYLSLVAVSLLALAVFNQGPPVLLVAVTLLIALAMGAAAGLVFGLMMHHVRDCMTALDYGIQSSLFALTRMLIPMFAGVLLDRLGYVSMLLSLAAGLLGVLLLVLHYRRAADLPMPMLGTRG